MQIAKDDNYLYYIQDGSLRFDYKERFEHSDIPHLKTFNIIGHYIKNDELYPILFEYNDELITIGKKVYAYEIYKISPSDRKTFMLKNIKLLDNLY